MLLTEQRTAMTLGRVSRIMVRFVASSTAAGRVQKYTVSRPEVSTFCVRACLLYLPEAYPILNISSCAGSVLTNASASRVRNAIMGGGVSRRGSTNWPAL